MAQNAEQLAEAWIISAANELAPNALEDERDRAGRAAEKLRSIDSKFVAEAVFWAAFKSFRDDYWKRQTE